MALLKFRVGLWAIKEIRMLLPNFASFFVGTVPTTDFSNNNLNVFHLYAFNVTKTITVIPTFSFPQNPYEGYRSIYLSYFDFNSFII